MKRARWIGVAALLALAAMMSWAQDMSSVAGAKEMCETFLQLITEEDHEGAYGYLRSMKGILDDANLEKIQQQNIEQAETILSAYGPAIDFRLADEQVVADSLLRMVYVVRRQKYIMRWKFIFYRPESTWRLASISYDDKLEELF